MPQFIRNFWIECDIDDRKSILSGGPKKENGGFNLQIYMRDNNKITQPIDITGYYSNNNKLVLELNLNTTNRDSIIIETDR